jgi:putative transposase
MRKKRFSVEQMIGVLRQAEVGVPVAEVIRKAGISEQTFYRWKAKYAGMEVDQVRQMAQLQEENLRLNRKRLIFPSGGWADVGLTMS